MRRSGRADKLHKLNGGALVEVWEVVEGSINFDKSRIVLLSRILLPAASMTTLCLIVSAG
jgi:hypothetical protein